MARLHRSQSPATIFTAAAKQMKIRRGTLLRCPHILQGGVLLFFNTRSLNESILSLQRPKPMRYLMPFARPEPTASPSFLAPLKSLNESGNGRPTQASPTLRVVQSSPRACAATRNSWPQGFATHAGCDYDPQNQRSGKGKRRAKIICGAKPRENHASGNQRLEAPQHHKNHTTTTTQPRRSTVTPIHHRRFREAGSDLVLTAEIPCRAPQHRCLTP